MTKTKIGTVYKLYTPSGKTYVGSTTKTMHYRMKAHILSYYANIKNPNYICCPANTLFQETIDVKCEILEEIVYSNKKEFDTPPACGGVIHLGCMSQAKLSLLYGFCFAINYA
jgi:hypothetical protein